MEDRLFGADELSTYLGVPQSTLAQWRNQGKGPAYIKVGAHVRYDLADVRTWLAEKRKGTAAQ